MSARCREIELGTTRVVVCETCSEIVAQISPRKPGIAPIMVAVDRHMGVQGLFSKWGVEEHKIVTVNLKTKKIETGVVLREDWLM